MSSQPTQPGNPAAPDPAEVATLRDSRDPDELAIAAQRLAVSTSPAAHELLRRHLDDAGFLARIDPKVGSGHIHNMNVWRPVRSLMQNDSEVARETVRVLCDSGTFRQSPARVDLLIDATAGVRPPTERVVKFWRAYQQPEKQHYNRIIPAVLQNGHVEALEYYKEAFAIPGVTPQRRASLQRRHLLPRRLRAEHAACADSIIRDEGRAREVRIEVAEAMFAYREEWYAPHARVDQPAWAGASPEVAAKLLALAEYVLETLKPDEPLATEVKAAREQLKLAAKK